MINSQLLRITVLFFALLAGSLLPAQSGNLPPFSMVKGNGQIFRAQDLPMGKPILLACFSPECDHCEKMLKNFLARPQIFKKHLSP